VSASLTARAAATHRQHGLEEEEEEEEEFIRLPWLLPFSLILYLHKMKENLKFIHLWAEWSGRCLLRVHCRCAALLVPC
jgi:hypothetical protein